MRLSDSNFFIFSNVFIGRSAMASCGTRKLCVCRGKLHDRQMIPAEHFNELFRQHFRQMTDREFACRRHFFLILFFASSIHAIWHTESARRGPIIGVRGRLSGVEKQSCWSEDKVPKAKNL